MKVTFWEREFRQRYGELEKYAFRHTGDHSLAEDAVQEAFEEALIHLDEWYVHENYVGWLYSTTDFKCRKIMQKHHRLLPFGEEFGELIQEESFSDKVELLCAIQKCITSQEFEVFQDVHERNLSSFEMACKYHCSENAIRMRISRIRKKIQKSI